MNLDQITEAVWERLSERKPRMLLVGEPPDGLDRYQYVKEKPYDAVLIGILHPAELLRMPCAVVCDALLEEIPVYLWADQPFHRAKKARALCQELARAEQNLRKLGVELLGMQKKLITADDARKYLKFGQKLPVDCRMTPFAKDILEGKET